MFPCVIVFPILYMFKNDIITSMLQKSEQGIEEI